MTNSINFNLLTSDYITSQGINKRLVTENRATLGESLFNFVNSLEDKNNDNFISESEINGTEGIDATDKTKATDVLKKVQAAQTTGTTPTGTTAATTSDPTKAIDEAKTAAFRAELTSIQNIYKEIGNDKERLQAEIDKLNTQIEQQEKDLTSALEEADYAGNKLEEAVKTKVSEAVKSATKDAKEGKGEYATLVAQNLANIGIDSSAVTSVLSQADGIGSQIQSLSSNLSLVSELLSIKDAEGGTFEAKYGALLTADPNMVAVTVSGQKIVIAAGSEGPAATGAEGISAADMAKFAGMSESELVTELGKDNYKDLVSGSGSTVEDLAKTIKSVADGTDVTDAAAGKYGTTDVKEKSINGITMESLKSKIGEVCPPKEVEKECTDPYEVKINGETYVFYQDNGDKVQDKNDIFGNKDTKNNVFASMKNLDTNKDGVVNADELKDAGVTLRKVDSTGALTGSEYNLNGLSVDLKSKANSTENNGKTGTFATFDVKLANGKTVEGKETFEKQSYFDKLFSKVASKASNLIGGRKDDHKAVSSTNKNLNTELVSKNFDTIRNTKLSINEQIDAMQKSIDAAKKDNQFVGDKNTKAKTGLMLSLEG